MIQFPTINLAMAALPKTATAWTVEALRAANVGSHNEGNHKHDLEHARKPGRVVFTQLRDPAQWVRSIWRYLQWKRQGLGYVGNLGGPCGILAPYCQLPFRKFVIMLCEQRLVDSLYLAYESMADVAIVTEHLPVALLNMLVDCRIELTDAQRKVITEYPPFNVSQYRSDGSDCELTAELQTWIARGCPVAYELWTRARA